MEKECTKAKEELDMQPHWIAVSALDGRYHKTGEQLAPYFSEFALMKYRTMVEIEWLIYLVDILPPIELPPGVSKFSEDVCAKLRDIYNDFNASSMRKIKIHERKTNHDVKSVELFIDDKLDELKMPELKPLVHIGCTSEDINNLAYSLMLKDGYEGLWRLSANNLISKLSELAKEWAAIPMLAYTHGQPATPTTLGKEFKVMRNRLMSCLITLDKIELKGKFNGATGNYAAMTVAYPGRDWAKLNCDFIENVIGLKFNHATTQIESHDKMAEMFDGIRRFNNIVRNIDKDIWLYIAIRYLVQKPIEGETGSSTMPHKVNPIKFENSEGNCEVSSSACLNLADELQDSRLQRDLTDSTLLRNMGTAVGHSIIALDSCLKGLDIIAPNHKMLEEDLENHPEVLAEAIQTVLRKHGDSSAYNRLKDTTRGKEVTLEDLREFISNTIDDFSSRAQHGRLDLECNSDLMMACQDLKRLLTLLPKDYIGMSEDIAKGRA